MLHNIIYAVLWAVGTLVFIMEIYALIYLIEYLVAIFVHHQPPYVTAGTNSQKKLVQYINKNYPNAKNICEVGSGYGRLARYIGKHTNANVIGLENMPISALISKFADLFQTKSKTIKCDAFEYLKNTDNKKFDIAVAYLSPRHATRLFKLKNKFKVLISLDFEVVNQKPTETIDLGPGYTILNNKKYPHKMFIYEI